MKTFPMFLQMQGRRVVIVGGGEQAAQKCRLMLKTEAEIVIYAPELEPELADLNRSGQVTWQSGAIAPRDFKNTALVFLATGCPGADTSLHKLAKEAGATVNVVDQPALCDALTPSIVDRSPVVVAIGTEGTAPVLARQIKTRVEEVLEPRLGDLAEIAGRLRDQAARRLAPRERRDLWRWVFSGPVRRAHARGAEREAAQMIKDAINGGGTTLESKGSVAIVGAGPGAKDLMTLRGVQRLQEADVIFYDQNIAPEILDLARRDAERVFIYFAQGDQGWPKAKSSGVIVAAALQGKRAVRICSGHVEVMSLETELKSALQNAQIAFEIVPGVPADDSILGQKIVSVRGV
jgi:uroporphyrin-III C-methyltransferase/precorrin-2 dehydrogenase/sirohydrochlorin ferrochelatase